MIIGKLNQIGLVFSFIRIPIRVALLYAIVVLRDVCHKSDNCLKTSFPNLVAVTDFNMHQSITSVTY